jgi:hypothetical protein
LPAVSASLSIRSSPAPPRVAPSIDRNALEVHVTVGERCECDEFEIRPLSHSQSITKTWLIILGQIMNLLLGQTIARAECKAFAQSNEMRKH